MRSATLDRVRWRRRGAWLWPLCAALTVVGGLIEHALPPAGESQALGAGILSAGFFNLLAVLLLSRPLGALLRRVQPSLPGLIARDFGGRIAVGLVSATLLGLGLAHRSTILAHQRATQDAIVMAQAWIGDHAPPGFRRQLSTVDVYAIEPGAIYRICVPDTSRERTYCVVVRTGMPLASSVSFAGYEPNSVLSAGAR